MPRHAFKTSSYIRSFIHVKYLFICNGIHHAKILSWISVCNGTHSIAKSFRWHMECNYGRMFTSIRNKYSTHWGRVTHICVNNKLNAIGSDDGSAPSHYLNQYWYIANLALRNKLQWNFNRNSYIFFKENTFQNDVWAMVKILSRLQCVNSLVDHKSIHPSAAHSSILPISDNRANNQWVVGCRSHFQIIWLITTAWYVCC